MDFAITINNQTGLGQMTYEKVTTLMNNIYLSLKIDRGSFFADTNFGSRLYLLRRAKNTDATMRLAMDYCREALQWMIDTGKAGAVEVYAERDRTQDLHRLKLLIEVTPANGAEPVAFTTFIEVI
jgi:phage gp46-like protein